MIVHYPPYPFPENRLFPLIPDKFTDPEAIYYQEVAFFPAVLKSLTSLKLTPGVPIVAGLPVRYDGVPSAPFINL